MCNETTASNPSATTVTAGAATAVPATAGYVSDIIGEDFKRWETGRVILDCGTGRGKNEFIIKKLVSWAVDQMLDGDNTKRVLYLCPLNSLHQEMMRRRLEAEIAELGADLATEMNLYRDALEIQTYQYIEKLRRNNPAYLEGYLSGYHEQLAQKLYHIYI